MNRVIQRRFNKVEMYVIYSNIIILQSIMSSYMAICEDIHANYIYIYRIMVLI